MKPISAGTAVPAYAGIPVTQRDTARACVFVTGHDPETQIADAIRDATIVVFMPIKNIDHIANQLIQSGRNPKTPAAMIYTGQTGWMQGGRYGLILDSLPNDFVSGSVERAIVSCFQAEHPDLIVIEGQAALRNPSGPCGAEFLVSGRASGVILQHHPTRRHYHGFADWGEIPSLQSELDLIAAYGVPVLGIGLNTGGRSPEEAARHRAAIESDTRLPTVAPLLDGVDRLVDVLRQKFCS